MYADDYHLRVLPCSAEPNHVFNSYILIFIIHRLLYSLTEHIINTVMTLFIQAHVKTCFYSLLHAVVTINFGPTIVYTVPEGTLAKVMIVLDKPCVKDITVAVTTMDITAQCEIDDIAKINVVMHDLLLPLNSVT